MADRVQKLTEAQRGWIWKANDSDWLYYRWDDEKGYWLCGTSDDPELPIWAAAWCRPNGWVVRKAGFTRVRRTGVHED